MVDDTLCLTVWCYDRHWSLLDFVMIMTHQFGDLGSVQMNLPFTSIAHDLRAKKRGIIVGVIWLERAEVIIRGTKIISSGIPEPNTNLVVVVRCGENLNCISTSNRRTYSDIARNSTGVRFEHLLSSVSCRR